MKVTIKFECVGAAFEGHMLQGEVAMLLVQAHKKIGEQLARKDGRGCVTPEAADLLYDTNGNRVGTVQVELEEQ